MSVLVTVPVALPREPGQTIGNSVAAVHAPIATHIADPKKRLLAVRDAMRDAKEEFNRLPLALNRAISSLGMLAVMMLPKRENLPLQKRFQYLSHLRCGLQGKIQPFRKSFPLSMLLMQGIRHAVVNYVHTVETVPGHRETFPVSVRQA